MKAIVFHQHGGPEVLKYTEAPDPTPRANEVLVRVKACALNHLDLWVRRGLPNVPIPLPHVPGSDVAGEIAQIGADVATMRVGQKVVLAPLVSCGKCAACIAGLDNRCRQATNLGYMIDGGCAEFVRAPEINCLPYPENLKWEEAASIPLVFQTAWHMLLARAELQPGEDVLILGAGSGVGTAAIQIAKFFGARVIATAGSDEKLAKAKELGADHLINHKTQKIRDEVRRITNKRGVDVVFEHVGIATWDDSLASLAASGRLVTCGATTGYDAKLDLRFLFSRQLSLLGSYMGTKAELHSVMRLVANGRLKPIVDRIFPLPEAAAAHAYLELGLQFGKVVLSV
ncbi:MAG TPA: zinc-binding dehydrogenase [Candidatus Acidoferrum sp.]|jgi:NADPH:quinone reductase-like Zn-dependent oxidoreductase|nr:zinc-binding dehydrogenase [Candidatus Acidoferrum sp.]